MPLQRSSRPANHLVRFSLRSLGDDALGPKPAGSATGGDRHRGGIHQGKSFTIDGEAVVLGPDGLSRFEELSRREAARTAILYAFDLIEA